MKVSDVMTKDPVVCLKSDSAQTVAALMKKHDIGSIPVVSDLESKRLQGIVTDRDLCLRIIAENRNPELTPIEGLMTRDPIICSGSDSLQKCETLMQENRIRRVPVVDRQGRCIGIIAQADVVLHDSSDTVGKMLAAVSTPRVGGFVGSRDVA
jgi:CBS domain-containing protein